MTRTTLYAPASALPAIAAALALSSTPLLAQQVQPTEPAPVSTTPAPPVSVDAPPVTTDTTVAAPPSTDVPAQTTTVKTRTVARTARTAQVRPAPAASRSVTTRTTSTRTAATRTTAPPPAPAAPAPVQSTNSGSAAAPVVDLTSQPPSQPAAASRPSKGADETLPIAGGALALLALGGAAYAISRRRRREREDAWHEDWADEPAMEEEPVVAAPAVDEPRHDAIVHAEQPAIVAPAAFTWGNRQRATEERDRDSDDDRLPGETWVERAYRGPSANNPSVSLKNRLRRAAFFDKRERDVAGGIAEPMDPDAGLPEAMSEEREWELS